MNTELLNGWLQLPPGPWPPDDRALLRLPPGPVPPAADVELRALEQMERLRPHQLVHPDLVTEGMNRLAQAMIALTAQSAPPVKPPPKPAPPPPPARPAAVAEPVTPPLIDLMAPAVPPPPPVPVAPPPPPTPAVLDAEVFEAEPVRAKRPRRKRKKSAAKAAPVAPVVPVEPPAVEPPGLDYRPDERRKGYAEIVALRRVLRAWEKLQPFVAVPSEELATPAAVFGFVSAVQACRQADPFVNEDWVRTHGRLVRALVRDANVLTAFRRLNPARRRELAMDWAHAVGDLRGRLKGMRRAMDASKPRRVAGSVVRDLRDWMHENPEWLLAALVFAGLAVAVVRTARG